MKSNQRRCAAGAFTVMAVVLALSSAAYACTVLLGKLTVWGVSAGSSGEVSAVGSGNTMMHCASPSGQANVGTTDALARQVKLSVAVEACGPKAGALGNGTYTVNYLPDKSSDCMHAARMGEFTLAASGATPAGGVGPFTIPGLGSDPNTGVLSTGVGGWADICIDDLGSVNGNQVPIFLL